MAKPVRPSYFPTLFSAPAIAVAFEGYLKHRKRRKKVLKQCCRRTGGGGVVVNWEGGGLLMGDWLLLIGVGGSLLIRGEGCCQLWRGCF